MTVRPKSKRPAPKRSASPPVVAETVPMGPKALPHPSIGLGLWALGRWTPDDETRTRAALSRGIERGIGWFDTAEVYGDGRSERILGDVLARMGPAADRLFVVSKVSWEHLRASQLRAALTATLHRLGRRSLPLYLVHAPDSRVPIAETMATLEALWKEGKVGAIGVSNFSLEELEAAQAALVETRIVVNQVRYNLFERDDADPIREYCRREQVVIEAYTPLLRGLLAGRYLDGERPPAEVRRFTQRLRDEGRFPELIERARAIRDLARANGVPMASIALHWLRRRGAAVLFGASSPAQADAALDAWSRVPTDEVLERADRIASGVS